MATIRKRKGKWTVEIRRKGHRKIYATFVQKSDAHSSINKVESDYSSKSIKTFPKLRTHHCELFCIDTCCFSAC